MCFSWSCIVRCRDAESRLLVQHYERDRKNATADVLIL